MGYLTRASGSRSTSISFAQKEAKSKSLEVKFYVHDMRTPAHKQAAVVLNLFTSIGYFEDKNDNQGLNAFVKDVIRTPKVTSCASSSGMTCAKISRLVFVYGKTMGRCLYVMTVSFSMVVLNKTLGAMCTTALAASAFL